MAHQSQKNKKKPKKYHFIQVQLWDTLVEFKWTKVNNRPSCVLWYSIRCRSIYHVPWGKHQFHSSLTKGVQTAVSLSTSGDKCVRSPRLDTNTWNCPLLAGVCKIPSISSSFWDGGAVASEMGSNWSLAHWGKTRSHRVIRSGSVASEDSLNYYLENMSSNVQTELHHVSRKAFQRWPLGVISLLLPRVFNAPAFTSNNGFSSKSTGKCAPGNKFRESKTNCLSPKTFFSPRYKRKQNQKLPLEIISFKMGWTGYGGVKACQGGPHRGDMHALIWRSFMNQEKSFVLFKEWPWCLATFGRYMMCSVHPYIHSWEIHRY